jgi:hypothetical protein
MRLQHYNIPAIDGAERDCANAFGAFIHHHHGGPLRAFVPQRRRFRRTGSGGRSVRINAD